jgi:hypothetical protein
MINVGGITPIGTRLIRGKILCDSCISAESPSLACRLRRKATESFYMQ